MPHLQVYDHRAICWGSLRLIDVCADGPLLVFAGLYQCLGVREYLGMCTKRNRSRSKGLDGLQQLFVDRVGVLRHLALEISPGVYDDSIEVREWRAKAIDELSTVPSIFSTR